MILEKFKPSPLQGNVAGIKTPSSLNLRAEFFFYMFQFFFLNIFSVLKFFFNKSFFCFLKHIRPTTFYLT